MCSQSTSPASRSPSGATVAGPERRSCRSPEDSVRRICSPGWSRRPPMARVLQGTPDDPSCRDRGRSRGDWPGNHSQGRAEVCRTARSRARGRRSAREHRRRGEAARRRLLDALAGGQRLVRLRARGHSAARRGDRRGRVCGHRARGRNGDVRARKRHRHGADQQGGAEPRRARVFRSHRIARAPIRRPGSRDDARARADAREPRLDAHPARRGAGATHAAAPAPRARRHPRRVAAHRRRAAAHRGGGAQPARR